MAIYLLVLLQIIISIVCHPELDSGSIMGKNNSEMKQYHVYILASQQNGTLYVGSTSNLIHRVGQHKKELVDGFTKKYKVTMLVHFEEAIEASQMVTRERQLKGWKREWKIALIEKNNPEWKDLYYELLVSMDPESSSG